MESWEQIISEIWIKYIFSLEKYVFENDNKLADILSWPQCVKQYGCTDIILLMCTTEFMLVLPMAQPD